MEPVFYVTDRARLKDDQLFSGERALSKTRNAIVAYGTLAEPVSEKTHGTCPSRAAFLSAIAKRFDPKKRAILVYTHGYYTTFRTAVENALAMQQTLRFAGPVIVYSWPSKVTSRLAYVNDESNASWSLAQFRSLLEDLLTKYPGTTISFASHSLGSRFAAEGIAFVGAGARTASGARHSSRPISTAIRCTRN